MIKKWRPINKPIKRNLDGRVFVSIYKKTGYKNMDKEILIWNALGQAPIDYATAIIGGIHG